MTQPSLAPEARHSLLQYVTGKYLLPANCRVIWNFDDPCVVGNTTMCFTVRFYQRNGNEYPICDTDQFYVEITSDESSKKVVTLCELGSSTDPNNANEARVKFSVRTAGQYKISVMVGSTHIAGSPFIKSFIPGKISVLKSRLVRSSSIVIASAGSPTVLNIEPRDDFGNCCIFDENSDPTKGYTVHIFDLNDQICEKYNNAIQLSHDKINSRINIIASFPEPVVLKAHVNYEGEVIPNSYFDLIVLSLSDTTLVHKNIASRKQLVVYDAKLLNISGASRMKPRRVLCYISPKQITIKELFLKIIPKRIGESFECYKNELNLIFNFLSKNSNFPALSVHESKSEHKGYICNNKKSTNQSISVSFYAKNFVTIAISNHNAIFYLQQ